MKKLLIVASVFALAGCGTLTNEQQGTLIGMTAGGIIGNQVGGGSGKAVATFIGMMVGGAVGSNIGRHLDQGDRAKVAQALETSPSGQASEWVNPDRGTRYRVTPEPAYRPRSHETCRPYTIVAYIDGRPQEIRGVACRQPDGTWRNQQ